MTRAACTSTFDAARAPIVKLRRLPPRSRTLSAGVVALLDLDDLPGLSSWRSTKRRNSAILIADALDRHRRCGAGR